MKELHIQIPILPAHLNKVTLEYYAQSSSGKVATPAKLYNLVMDKMLTGIAVFIFQKKDGMYRQAIGTLNPAMMPVHNQLDATGHINTPLDKPNQAFYDLEVQSFKSFGKDRVVAIIML